MEGFWSALVARGGKRRLKEDHDALKLILWSQNLVASARMIYSMTDAILWLHHFLSVFERKYT